VHGPRCLVALGLSIGCGSATPGATEPVASAPARTYRHDLGQVEKLCSGAGRCVRYVFRWPADTDAHLELKTEGFAGQLIVDELHHTPDPDGVVRLDLEAVAGRQVRVLVAADTYARTTGPVELTVRPAPEELELPEPPPSAAAMRATAEADQRRLVDEATRAYAEAIAGRERVTTAAGDLGAPRPLSVKLKVGRCYRAVLRTDEPLIPPAGWTRHRFGRSAQVGGSWRGRSRGVGVSVTDREMVGASDELCPTSSGGLTVSWPKTDDPVDGPYTLEVWARALSGAERRKIASDEEDAKADIDANDCVRCQRAAIRCLDANTRGACVRTFRACLAEAGQSQHRCPL
jgi:hypothetical protein